jgi:O-antigen/teichoic acid export membrane protein
VIVAADVPVRRALFGQGSIYTAASAVQAVSTLLVLPVVTRLLGAEELGLVAAGTVVAQLLAMIGGLGLSNAILLEYFGDPGGIHRARRLVGATAVVAVLTVGLADLAGPLWIRGFSEIDYTTAFRVAVWSAAPIAVLGASQALLRARGQAAAFVVATVLATAGGHALGALAVHLTDGDAGAYFGGLLAGSVLGAAVGLAVGGIERPRRDDLELLSRSLRLGVALVPHALAMYALLAVDRLLIESVLGLDAAGRYQVAYLLGGAGLSLLVAVNNAWAPMVIGARDDQRWSVLAATTRDLETLVPAAVAFLALGAPVLVGIAAPSDYGTTELARVVAIVSVSALPYLWYLAGVHILLFHRDAGALLRVTPVAVVLAVVANLLVLDRSGLVGAAIVTVASYAFLAWRVHAASVKHAQPPWNAASSTRATVLVAVALVSALTLPTDGLGLVLRALVGLTILGVVAATLLGHRERADALGGRPGLAGLDPGDAGGS